MTRVHIKDTTLEPRAAKGYKGMAMEGLIAAWYAKNTRNQTEFEVLAKRLSGQLAPGANILEVAPGPGYLSIELAKPGRFRVTGLDISKSFVEIAQKNAREAGIAVEFRLGNASEMPFENATFDFIVCRAAFKNFSEPVRAIREMYRVLRPGGKALIIDLRHDAPTEAIDAEIQRLGMQGLNALFTKLTFQTVLLKNAYTVSQIRDLVAQTKFGQCRVETDAIGMEIWLDKPYPG